MTTPSAPDAAAILASLPPRFLDNTIGAAFIGLLIAAILFGVTNVQCLLYYQSYLRDPPFLKYLVSFLWFLDTFQLVLITHVLYNVVVTNFTNLAAISATTWSLSAHVIVTTLSDFIVRSFYARRVWILSGKSWILTGGTLVFSLITFGTGIGFAAKCFTFQSTTQFTEISWDLYLSLGSSTLADIWVAASLCWFLSQNRTGFKSTDSKINVLIAYIINTGLLTSICATLSLIMFATMPDNYVFLGFYFILPKLYFNSFLATLNARSKLREDPSHNVNSFINMQHLVSNGVQRPITQLVSPTPQEKGHTTSATADSEVDYPRDTWKAAADSRGGVYSV